MTIEPTTTEINIQTTYTFGLDRFDNGYPELDVPQNAYIEITFPSVFVLPATTTCLATAWYISPYLIPTLSCTITGQKLRVNNGFATFQANNKYNSAYVFTATNFKNLDQTGLSEGITAIIYKSDGSQLDSTSTSTQITYTPSKFISCQFSPENSTVNSKSKVLVSLQPKNSISTGGYLIITLPLSWSTHPFTVAPSIVFNVNTMQCSNGTNTDPKLNCTLNQTVSPPQLNVTTLSSATLSGNFQFYIDSIVNPPSTQSSGSFTVTSYDNQGRSRDSCSNINYQVQNPNSLFPTTYTQTSSVVNSLSDAKIVITLNSPVAQTNYYAVVQFPIELGLSNIFSVVGTNCWTRNLQYNINQNIVTFSTSNFFKSFYKQGQTCDIQFFNIKSPASTKPTSSFQINTYVNGYMVDQINSGVTFTATKALLVNATVKASNTQIGSNTDYIFTIQIGNPLSQTSSILITFPSTITPQVRVAESCDASGFPSQNPINPQVTCSVSGSILTLTNLFSADYLINTADLWNITVKVPRVQNSISPRPSSPFFIVTKYDSSGFTVEDTLGVNISITGSAAPFDANSVQVYPKDLQVGKLTTYTIIFTAKHGLYAQGYIVLQLPNTILGIDQYTVQSSCKLNDQFIACVYNETVPGLSAKITFKDIPSDFAAGSSINITLINCIVNPASTKLYSSFTLQTYTQDGFLINFVLQGVSVTMTLPSKFADITLSRTNFVNGFQTDYSFQFTPTIAHNTGHKVKVIFPAEITLPNSIQCQGLSANLASSQLCTKSQNQITISLNILGNGIIDANAQFSIKILSVSNPISVLITSNIQVISSEANENNLIHSNTDGPTVKNTFSGQITRFTGVPAQAIMGAETTYTFSFDSINQIPSSNNGIITITLPQEFSINVGTFDCSNFVGFLTPTCTQSNRVITIKAYSFVQTGLSFDLKGIINPRAQISDFFNLQTYQIFSGVQYIIDKSDNLVKFSLVCALPCEKCLSSQTSACQSCYTDGTLPGIGGYIQLDINNQKCISNCQVGQYQVGNTCLQCSNVCLECFIASTNCTSCPAGKYYHNYACIANCPQGFFADTQTMAQCLKCQGICETCFKQSSNCTNCAQNYFMFRGVCLNQCPADISIPNSNSRTCDSCISPCGNCISTVTTCTRCLAGYYLSNAICYQNCPYPLVQDILTGNCVACKAPCSTCNVTPTNCTSCSINFLLGNICIQNCTGNFYNNQNTLRCESCSVQCYTCSTFTECTSCYPQGTLPYLQGTQCVASCQQGYYADSSSGQCLKCQYPCQTCTSLLQCQSCVNTDPTKKSCRVSCPPLFVIDGYQCTACNLQCADCQVIPSNCSSCIPPYLFTSSLRTCTQTCSFGLFEYQGSCVPCQSPCKTCNNSFQSCSSCLSTFYLYQQQCTLTCPGGYYKEDASLTCKACVSPCATCSSLTQCLTCAESHPLQYNSQCVQTCPADLPLAIGQKCQSCMQYCKQCTSLTECTTCQAQYLLLTGSCVNACPVNYEPDEKYINCIKKSTVQMLQENFASSKFVPFPYIIGLFIFGISTVIAKFQHPETFVAGTLAGFGSLIEYASWATLIYLQIQKNLNDELWALSSSASKVTLACLILNLILNLAVNYQYKKHIVPDIEYQEWIQQDAHKTTEKIIKVISLISTHKFLRSLYCKYFGFSFFKLKLASPDILSPLNTITAVSIVFCSFPIIFSAGYTAYNDEQKQQLFISSLDTVCITILLFIFIICETQKPKTFFEEQVIPDNGSIVSNSRMFPFEFFNANSKSPLMNGMGIKKIGSNSHLSEFSSGAEDIHRDHKGNRADDKNERGRDDIKAIEEKDIEEDDDDSNQFNMSHDKIIHHRFKKQQQFMEESKDLETSQEQIAYQKQKYSPNKQNNQMSPQKIDIHNANKFQEDEFNPINQLQMNELNQQNYIDYSDTDPVPQKPSTKQTVFYNDDVHQQNLSPSSINPHNPNLRSNNSIKLGIDARYAFDEEEQVNGQSRNLEKPIEERFQTENQYNLNQLDSYKKGNSGLKNDNRSLSASPKQSQKKKKNQNISPQKDSQNEHDQINSNNNRRKSSVEREKMAKKKHQDQQLMKPMTNNSNLHSEQDGQSRESSRRKQVQLNKPMQQMKVTKTSEILQQPIVSDQAQLYESPGKKDNKKKNNKYEQLTQNLPYSDRENQPVSNSNQKKLKDIIKQEQMLNPPSDYEKTEAQKQNQIRKSQQMGSPIKTHFDQQNKTDTNVQQYNNTNKQHQSLLKPITDRENNLSRQNSNLSEDESNNEKKKIGENQVIPTPSNKGVIKITTDGSNIDFKYYIDHPVKKEETFQSVKNKSQIQDVEIEVLSDQEKTEGKVLEEKKIDYNTDQNRNQQQQILQQQQSPLSQNSPQLISQNHKQSSQKRKSQQQQHQKQQQQQQQLVDEKDKENDLIHTPTSENMQSPLDKSGMQHQNTIEKSINYYKNNNDLQIEEQNPDLIDLNFKSPHNFDINKQTIQNNNPFESKKIYDSEDSIRTISEGQMDFNEISPTDYNILNQRYEEDFFIQPLKSITSGQNTVNVSKNTNQINNNQISYEPLNIKSVQQQSVERFNHQNNPSLTQGSRQVNRQQSRGRTTNLSSINQQYDISNDLGTGDDQKQKIVMHQQTTGHPTQNQNTKIHNVDVNRLKSLEKIYLQRIDNQPSQQKSNSRNKKLNQSIQQQQQFQQQQQQQTQIQHPSNKFIKNKDSKKGFNFELGPAQNQYGNQRSPKDISDAVYLEDLNNNQTDY